MLKSIAFFVFVYLLSPLVLAQSNSEERALKSLDSLKTLEGIYWRNKNNEKALFVCHEVVNDYAHLMTRKEKSYWLLKLSGVYSSVGSNVLAIENLTKALSCSDTDAERVILGQIGSSYIQLDKLDSAASYYNLAINASPKIYDKIPHYNSLGFVYYLKNEFTVSKEQYKKGLELFENADVQDSIQFYIIQSNLASIAFAERDYDAGINILEKIKAWHEKTEDVDFIFKEACLKLLNHFLITGNCEKSNDNVRLLDQVYQKLRLMKFILII